MNSIHDMVSGMYILTDSVENPSHGTRCNFPEWFREPHFRKGIYVIKRKTSEHPLREQYFFEWLLEHRGWGVRFFSNTDLTVEDWGLAHIRWNALVPNLRPLVLSADQKDDLINQAVIDGKIDSRYLSDRFET